MLQYRNSNSENAKKRRHKGNIDFILVYNQKKEVNVMGLKEQARRIIRSEYRAGAIGRTTEAVLVSMRMREEKKGKRRVKGR